MKIKTIVLISLFFFTRALFVQATPIAPLCSNVLHFSSDKTTWNTKEQVISLSGHARVERPKEQVTASRILLDLKNRWLHAWGEAEYLDGEDIFIQAQKLQFHLDQKIGTAWEARLTNGFFVIQGSRMKRLSRRHFLVSNLVYSTCYDCPQSWSIFAKEADLTLEGYGFLKNVRVQVQDASVFWLPYLVIPLKAKRQTGFLFPKTSFSSRHGWMFVLPFFLVLNPSADMTFGTGIYTERGKRFEWEGRYLLGNNREGTLRFFLQEDQTKRVSRLYRWAVDWKQKYQNFWKGLDARFQFEEVSDLFYPVDFNDVPGRAQGMLTSALSVSRSKEDLSTSVSVKRYRHLLNFDQPTKVDQRVPWLLPQIVITTPDQFLTSFPISLGMEFRWDHFWRGGRFFDRDFCQGTSCPKPTDPFQPGKDPIRKAHRFALEPHLKVSTRLWDWLEWTPVLSYRGYFYQFPKPISSLSRGYVLFQSKWQFQLEKIWDRDSSLYPRMKHLIRPQLIYSRIPLVHASDQNHPFLKQITYRNGYHFDDYDLVPLGTSPSLVNYFTPLGHSLTYQLNTQWIRKEKQANHFYYRKIIDLSAGQTLNLLELKKSSDQRVLFSRFSGELKIDLGTIQFFTQYYYYPHLSRLLTERPLPSAHQVSSSFTWIWERSFHKTFLAFDRSMQFSYRWDQISAKVSSLQGAIKYSLSDYILPSFEGSYDFLRKSFVSATLGFLLQNPSRCWQLHIALSDSVDQGKTVKVEFAFNLTGKGFLNLQQLPQNLGSTTPSSF